MIDKILNAGTPFSSMSAAGKIHLLKKLFLTYHKNHALLLCLAALVLFAARPSKQE